MGKHGLKDRLPLEKGFLLELMEAELQKRCERYSPPMLEQYLEMKIMYAKDGCGMIAPSNHIARSTLKHWVDCFLFKQAQQH